MKMTWTYLGGRGRKANYLIRQLGPGLQHVDTAMPSLSKASTGKYGKYGNYGKNQGLLMGALWLCMVDELRTGSNTTFISRALKMDPHVTWTPGHERCLSHTKDFCPTSALPHLIQKRPPSAFTLRYSAISHDCLAALSAVARGAQSPYVTALQSTRSLLRLAQKHPPPRRFASPFWSSCIYTPSSILRCYIFRKGGPSIHHRLLSTLTPDTPVSGFYGPGSWWAWLITLGMSHMHMVGALVRTGRVPLEWDYDLIAASYYTVIAAVDLIVKSREIARLGPTASDSTLLPALTAAEYVVWVGTASSMFTLWKGLWGALYGPGFRFSSFKRTTGIAIVPVLSAFVAWGFSLRAHQAIAQTAPVFWCFAHNWNNEDPMGILHMPAEIALPWAEPYASPLYWQFCSVVRAAVTIVVFLRRIVGGETQRRGLWFAAKAGFISFACASCLSLVVIGCFVGLWASTWLLMWWPVYILALSPWVGYFPATGISVLEMDQIAVLLAVAVVAAIRFGLCGFHASETHELGPLLPT
ncbi:hypothetical protein C8R44DRAFT_750793 [Mycena epipterygia]|nr:hypothetical protein C8R44DRAFT_750793 [Mycena epipterygia]